MGYGLSEGGINVTVQRGCVTLSGEVRWHFQRVAAEKAVKELGGVVGVNNLLAIRPIANVANICSRIENGRRNAQVEAGRIRIDVVGGKVVLEGDVYAWNESNATERAAWSVPGVTMVDNRIAVTEFADEEP